METRKRSVVKALGYRVFSFTGTLLVLYIFNLDVVESLKQTIYLTAGAILLYYLWERMWSRITWGTYTSPPEMYMNSIVGIKEYFDDHVPKYSILQPYSQVKYIPVKLRAFADLMRPFTMVASMVAGISIVALYSAYYGLAFDPRTAFLAGLVLALLQGAGQAMNQSLKEEVDIDIANGKTYRPTVLGIISLNEGKIFSLALCKIAVALAFFVNFEFGLYSIVIAFFAIFYTAPPLRMKKRFMWNNVWQGVSRGLLPWVAVWSISGSTDTLPFALGIVTATWLIGYQTCKDFNDINGDRRYGINTLPVVLGVEQSILFMGGMGVIAFLFLLQYTGEGTIPERFQWLLVLAIPSFLILRDLLHNRKSNLVENNRAWGLMYGTLGLFYILPAVIMWF